MRTFYLKNIVSPTCILLCIYDCFYIFDPINDADAFHIELISFHPFLQFIMEGENNYTIFYVLVERRGGLFITSARQKPTFTGLRKLLFFCG